MVLLEVSRLFKMALVLVRFDHVASFIVYVLRRAY